MLKEIQIAGFKTLAQPTTIKLEPISVLVGANNSGKTNVLAAIGLIGEISRVGLNKALEPLGGWSAVKPRSGGPPFHLVATGRVRETDFRYELGLGAEHKNGFIERFDVDGAISFATGNDSGSFMLWNNRSSASGSPGSGLWGLMHQDDLPNSLREVLDFLGGIRTFDFSVPALRAPATIDVGAHLARDGSDLAAVLDELAGRFPRVRDEIEVEVSKAADVARVVTLPVEKGSKVVGIQEKTGQIFTAEEMSDGLLIFIALSTVIQMSGGKTLIGIEELEKGVHPRRISEVVDQLIRVSGNGSQFVLTTHSPVLLNEFRDYPERVLICDREGEQTHVTSLSARPDWEEMLKGAALGDVWYSGVLGGVPQ